MTSYTFVLAIIALVLGAGIWREALNRDRKAKMAAAGAGGEERLAGIEARLEKLAALEERVQVLEKIVTDRGNSLADEIESL